MRLDPPVVPWDEPLDPAIFRAPAEFVDAANDERLIPMLRGAAKTRNPVLILAWAATEFFRAERLRPSDAERADATAALATALADLAVTGREAYRRFRGGVSTLSLEGTTRLRIEAQVGPPRATDAEIAAAITKALDRAFAVAWALRGPVELRATLRGRLGWCAVSGEDDTPHRPVNMPAPPYEQYEVTVTVPVPERAPLGFATRFFVACAVDGPRDPEPVAARRPPTDQIPDIPADHDVLLFLHGHSSGAEEALDIVPHLLEQGLRRGRRYAVIAFDLPNNGYSETFDHTRIAPASATTFPFLPTDNTPIATPILDFIENFVVAFVDSVDNAAIVNGRAPIKDRIAAVFGGSLGGNLGLRLGRRAGAPPWLRRAIVSWSPASVWTAMVKNNPNREGPRVARDNMNEPESATSRWTYFNEVYDRGDPLPGVIKRQTVYWYRRGFPTTELHLAVSRLARREIYNAFYRQWHWRVACEQLIYSHVENEVYGDASTPVRYTKNRTPMLLAAGWMDNSSGTMIYDATRKLGQLMTRTPGRLLLVRDTGHSIHIERPQWFGGQILDFVGAKWMEIRCVVLKAGRIDRVGGFDHSGGAPFTMSVQECIARIAGGDQFYAVASNGDVAAVVVAQMQGAPGPLGTTQWFIKTEADDALTNNLLSLPSC